jgi:hypothetical protein
MLSAFFYSFGALVLSTPLADEDFYKLAAAERALWICSDDEKNLQKLQTDRSRGANMRKTPERKF